MPLQITIRAKTKEKTVTKKTKSYEENIEASYNDPVISNMVEEVLKEFGSDSFMVKVDVSLKLLGERN